MSDGGNYDAIVVGAGPAGLTSGIYLGRFRRRCLLLEDGGARARWIPTSHNIPGFTAGIGGTELLARMRQQAEKYGTQFRSGRVAAVTIENGNFIVSTGEQERFGAPYVLLATGTKDHLPDLPGASEAVMRSVLRFCPVCDGFEAIDQRIAVVGNGSAGEREAKFLTTFSKTVSLLQLDSTPSAAAAELQACGIEYVPVTLSELSIEDREVALRAKSGQVRRFDAVYLALGCSAQNLLALQLGADCDEGGALIVNAHQETSVSGLYAAGDVVRGLNQVIIAAAEGAIAATDIHNKLRATPTT
jgi:thioredoxin reductase (NADPH)